MFCSLWRLLYHSNAAIGRICKSRFLLIGSIHRLRLCLYIFRNVERFIPSIRAACAWLPRVCSKSTSTIVHFTSGSNWLRSGAACFLSAIPVNSSSCFTHWTTSSRVIKVVILFSSYFFLLWAMYSNVQLSALVEFCRANQNYQCWSFFARLQVPLMSSQRSFFAVFFRSIRQSSWIKRSCIENE